MKPDIRGRRESGIFKGMMSESDVHRDKGSQKVQVAELVKGVSK